MRWWPSRTCLMDEAVIGLPQPAHVLLCLLGPPFLILPTYLKTTLSVSPPRNEAGCAPVRDWTFGGRGDGAKDGSQRQSRGGAIGRRHRAVTGGYDDVGHNMGVESPLARLKAKILRDQDQRSAAGKRIYATTSLTTYLDCLAFILSSLLKPRFKLLLVPYYM
jgi:hypothetical protein